jgi:hypothetical protein
MRLLRGVAGSQAGAQSSALRTRRCGLGHGERREELDALGWRLIVVTAADLYDAPEEVLARVRAVLIERGATGIRRQFKTEWLRYFTAS